MNTTIKVEHLKKSYGNTCVVNDISLSVNEGEVFGLLGANGAGKSTTIECILGTRQADSGTVEILGMCPTKERKRLFENVGVQFQESNYQEKILVSELCEETQCLYKEVKILLKQFGLSDKLKSPVSELSGGQKQKLFIVLALIPNPKVVFLDELTTGLDTKARRDVWKCLSELKKKGLTIFLTSHFCCFIRTAAQIRKEFTGLCILLKLHNHTHIRNRDIRDFQDCFHIKLLQLFLRITTGVKEFIQHLDLILKSCFVFHENTSLANVDYNRNTAALFFFLRIT